LLIGASSFSGWNGFCGESSGFTRMLDGLAISTVYPSGAAFATCSAAMLEPAPGRLSTRIGWPSARASGSCRLRATKSAAPPGAKPTTSRTGLDG
jgi:hypothetical protein